MQGASTAARPSPSMMSHGARAPLSRMLEHIRERTARHEAPVTHETLLTARELGHERGAQLGHTVGIHRIGDGIVLLARVDSKVKVLFTTRL